MNDKTIKSINVNDVLYSLYDSSALHSIVDIEWENLKNMRDNSELTPGAQYKIIDYVTTTTQTDTMSAGHFFDIIVTADSTNTLNESSRVCKSARDVDNYYDGSDLKSWVIKYSIDNDTNRFAWADEVNGKGVIWYMEDEWDNSCRYDFSNIMFKRYKISFDYESSLNVLKGRYLGTSDWTGVIDTNDYVWRYTFSWVDEVGNLFDMALVGNKEALKDLNNPGMHSNHIGDAGVTGTSVSRLNNVVIIGDYVMDGNTFNGCICNVFGIDCKDSTFGNGFNNNTLKNNISNIIMGAMCSGNVIQSNCSRNVFGNTCENNNIGTGCHDNRFGTGFSHNNLVSNCLNNVFGLDCVGNSLGNSSSNNIFGDNCTNNTLGNYCDGNKFGNYMVGNTLANMCRYITISTDQYGNDTCSYIRNFKFEDGVSNLILIFDENGSMSKYHRNVVIERGVCGNNSSYRLKVPMCASGSPYEGPFLTTHYATSNFKVTYTRGNEGSTGLLMSKDGIALYGYNGLEPNLPESAWVKIYDFDASFIL